MSRNINVLHKKKLNQNLFILSILIYPALLFFVFYVYVNFNSLLLAFQDITLDGKRTFVGLKNFSDFINQVGEGGVLSISIVNSLKMFFINIIICIPLYVLFSFYFYKKHAGSKMFRLIIMVPAIVSTFIMSMVFIKFVEIALPAAFLDIGFGNLPSLLKSPDHSFGTNLFFMIWISFSTSLIVFPNAMNSIPDEVVESAHIDGVNMFKELWYITLPLIYPTLSTFIVVGVAGIFTNAGPLIAFYMYTAPPEVSNIGYYMTAEVMRDSANAVLKYPFLSAVGICITLVSAPITYLTKHLMEKFGPQAEF